MDNKPYLNYFNHQLYGLNEIKELKNRSFVSYYKYATLLDTACKYNPTFAKRHLDSRLNVSTLSPSNVLLFNEVKRRIYKNNPKSHFEVKYTFKDIFNTYWENYVERFSEVITIPDYVFDNVERMSNCRTSALGFTLYECGNCNNYKHL